MILGLFEEEEGGALPLSMRDVGTKVYYNITVEVYQCSRWISDCGGFASKC